jgi:DNA-directed RNA polymerase specialized sigma24 family protein
MTINQITTKELNKLNLYAKCIVNDEDYAKDLVQNFILKMLEKGKGDLEINSGYTFKGLRLLFLEEMYIENAQFRKRFAEEYQHFKKIEEEETETKEESEIKKEEQETQTKLNVITNVYDQLNQFDKQLYYVHYVKGISQRQISRETGIKLGVIQYRFKMIKEKIITNFNNK